MNLSNNIISFIIMILIPTIVFTGTNLLFISDESDESNNYKIPIDYNSENNSRQYKEDLYNKRERTFRITSYIHLFIGIIILFSSLYFNTKIWGIPAGGAIIIIGHIFFRWYNYNKYIRFMILLLLLVLLILFLILKNKKKLSSNKNIII